MQQKYDPDIKLNKFGNPDIDFYVSEAKRLRTDAISALIHNFKEWLKKTAGKGSGSVHAQGSLTRSP